MVNYQITISGRVQGVGFRWTCLQLAQEMGVTGFVRNLPNGQVYVEAQGNPATIKTFIARIKSGLSPYIRVRHVDATAGNIQDYGGQFTIRR